MKVITAVKRGRPLEEPKRRDLGTPELIARRQIAVGSGDPTLATFPLGIMLARQIIDLDEFAAGEHYRMLYGRASGRAKDCGLDVSGSSGTEGELERITDQYRAMTALLENLGRSVLTQVVNVAVFGHRDGNPVWLTLYLHNPHPNSWKVHQHHQDFIDLQTGLREMAK